MAWEIISEISTEVLRRQEEEDNDAREKEENVEKEEKEDVVKVMEKKAAESLQHKRSFFVRMVSDPKLYNPKIVKMDGRHRMLSMEPSDPARFRNMPDCLLDAWIFTCCIDAKMPGYLDAQKPRCLESQMPRCLDA
jgi:archaellum component FlaD/FlaE